MWLTINPPKDRTVNYHYFNGHLLFYLFGDNQKTCSIYHDLSSRIIPFDLRLYRWFPHIIPFILFQYVPFGDQCPPRWKICRPSIFVLSWRPIPIEVPMFFFSTANIDSSPNCSLPKESQRFFGGFFASFCTLTPSRSLSWKISSDLIVQVSISIALLMINLSRW